MIGRDSLRVYLNRKILSTARYQLNELTVFDLALQYTMT